MRATPPDAVTGNPHYHQRITMRYQARWSNGYWKTFDCERFMDVEPHPTRKMAEEAVAAMNAARRK